MTLLQTDILQTRTAKVALTNEGIIRVEIKERLEQTLDDAAANLSAATQIAEGCRRPLLINIQHCEMLTTEVRQFYGTKTLDENFVALAMLVSVSPWGIAMGNIYLRVARHRIPVKLFQSERSAVEWLLAQD